MKKKHRRFSVPAAFVLKTVLWLVTAALLCAGVFSGGGRLSLLLLGSAAAMGLVSLGITLWLDTRASRREYWDDE